MKLWVDDIRNPESFNKYAYPDEWVWVKTITEAIRVLANQKVEVVSLDHDICHDLPGGGPLIQPLVCPENYTAVAWYIAAMDIDSRPAQVFVHTANPAGSGEIHNILRGLIGVEVIRRNL